MAQISRSIFCILCGLVIKFSVLNQTLFAAEVAIPNGNQDSNKNNVGGTPEDTPVPDEGQSGIKGAMVDSVVKTGQAEKHFVSTKKPGDSVQLRAQIPHDLDAKFDTYFEWVKPRDKDTGLEVGTAAGSRFNVPRDKPGKYTVEVRTKGTGTVATVDKINVWIVWADLTNVKKVPITSGAGRFKNGDFTVEFGLKVSGGYNFVFTISPSSIITDLDRPDLTGENKLSTFIVNPPGADIIHIVSGEKLAKGADTKWDISRRIREKVLNPSLYGVGRLPFAAGGAFNSQPVAQNVPVQFPASDDRIGNDDSSTKYDEENNPYDQFYGSVDKPTLEHKVGELASRDVPNMLLSDNTGLSDGETFEIRMHFGEFVRILIGDRWYRCSDFVDWRAHFKLIRQSGSWVDNQSEVELNNDNF